ncbi:MAG: hypothetical protein IVW57_07715 [Ktedonobacterales bacterium]|nr:hypothetical protein [Ktedonobacterales bacterium]
MEPPSEDEPLPQPLVAALAARGIAARDEVGLRRALERRLAGYTLCHLPPAAARRWKARYRILFGTEYLDGQTPAEVYARALLATFDHRP